MKIYIASSWRNQHAVEMLTEFLEKDGHEVCSFVREAAKTEIMNNLKFDVEKWINSEDGQSKFRYDIESAMSSDCVIYIGPSGEDAAAECGMAFARGVPILGLCAKGTSLGLMRRMMTLWCHRYTEILEVIREWS